MQSIYHLECGADRILPRTHTHEGTPHFTMKSMSNVKPAHGKKHLSLQFGISVRVTIDHTTKSLFVEIRMSLTSLVFMNDSDSDSFFCNRLIV